MRLIYVAESFVESFSKCDFRLFQFEMLSNKNVKYLLLLN